MNKDVVQTVLFGLAFAGIGYSLYTKYIRKKDERTSDPRKKSSSITSSSKDDDYEPYLKK